MILQVHIPAAQNNRYFVVGSYGVFNIRVLNIDYHQTGNASTVIRVVSDKLMTKGSTPFLTFINNPSTNLTIDSSNRTWSYEKVPLDGQILFNVIDISTGTTPANMSDIVLTYELEEVKN